ncbi:radical SAM protein [Candidatus Woesearchaeota archaeon]|nr:radical SAM protein [Candidatus Woesearchaeota archaeon]
MPPDIYFVTTRNCNLKCGHCYLSAGPGLEHTTVSTENFQKAVDNLPKKKIRLVITGGEVFTMQEQLYNYLSIVKRENKERRRTTRKGAESRQITINLQTNGLWAKSPYATKKVIKKLSDFEVSYLDVSRDQFHTSQGVTEEALQSIYDVAKRAGIRTRFGGIDAIGYAFSKGRSAEKTTPNKDTDRSGILDCNNSLRKQHLTIREDGRVYSCCYSVFSYPGNLFEEPLESIVAKARQDPAIQEYERGGVAAIAIAQGHDEKFVAEYVKKNGACALCLKLYG